MNGYRRVADEPPACDLGRRLVPDQAPAARPAGQYGGVAKDNRRLADVVLWIARTGAAWADLPERPGNWNSPWRQFDRWAQ